MIWTHLTSILAVVSVFENVVISEKQNNSNNICSTVSFLKYILEISMRKPKLWDFESYAQMSSNLKFTEYINKLSRDTKAKMPIQCS